MQSEPLADALPGERAVAAVPRPAPLVDAGWRRRLRFHPGRHLTSSDFDLEHDRHSQHLHLLGLRLGRGVAHGLTLRAVRGEPWRSSPEAAAGSPWHLLLEAGHGLLADGRDVVNDREQRVALDALPVAVDDQLVDDQLARGVGLIVAQPVVLGLRDGATTSACRLTEADLAFADLQAADGLRLAWLPLPAIDGLPTLDDPQARNELCYALFAYEQRHGSLPGGDELLPLAAAMITPEGEIAVFDAHAARRESNLGARRILGGGGPPLWRARIDQFGQHLAELQAAEAAPVALAERFRYLPPVGLLPPQAVDWTTRRSAAFPPAFRINASPVSESQLEALLAASRDLAPLDSAEAEQVELLVPVPDRAYDPELLQIALEDPRFAAEETALVAELRLVRRDRDLLDQMADEVLGALSAEAYATHPAPEDADALADETVGPPAGSPLPAPDHAAQASTALNELSTGIREAYPWADALATQLPAADFGGLGPWLEDLQRRIDASDDAIDQYFLSLRSDIHRVRQVLGGTATASRIGTSPVLAELAEGAKGQVDPDRLQRFFAAPAFQTTTAAMVMAGNGDSGEAPTPEGLRMMTRRLSTPPMSMEELGRLTAAAEAETPASLRLMGEFKPLVRNEAMPETRFVLPKLDLKLPWFGASGLKRTVQLVDRVRQPPAVEAMNQAVSTKARVLRALADLDLAVGDLPVTLVTNSLALLDQRERDALTTALSGQDGWGSFQNRITSYGRWSSVRVDQLSADESRLLARTVPLPAGDGAAAESPKAGILLSRNLRRSVRLDQLAERGLIDAILNGVTDPEPSDSDESAYVSAAVAALEGAVEVLRRVEARVQAHGLILQRGAGTHQQLQRIAGAWADHLAATEALLAEVRHDLVVARGLHAEEQRRIASVNNERARILREEVRVLAFARPRHGLLPSPLPSAELHPRFVDPIPQLLASELALPEELAAVVDATRHVPLGWFPQLAKLIEQVDRRERMQALFQRSRERALLRAKAPLAAPPQVLLAGAAGAALQRLGGGLRALQQRFWQQRQGIDPQVIAGLSWRAQRERALAELSLEDLLDGGRDAGALAGAASELLRSIGLVVQALYQRVAALPPVVRLAWIERVSIHDRGVDLREPVRILPGWTSLDYERRRELEHLVAWLVERFAPAEGEAQDLASDLIQAAILVAARAPAAELARGHLEHAERGGIGHEFEIRVTAGLPRIGMRAELFVGTAVAARAVVTDLVGDRARVKVVASSSGRFDLPAGTRLALRGAELR